MILWFAWMQAVRSLRPACRRSRTFLWMVLALMGLCCRSDRAGVTSYVRVLDFGSEAYHRFLHLFHSKACWVRLCLMLFQPMLAGSRMVCLADGIKAPQRGQADARREDAPSAIGQQLKAGIHHGPFVSGHFLAGPGSFRTPGSGAADIAHS